MSHWSDGMAGAGCILIIMGIAVLLLSIFIQGLRNWHW